MFKFIRDHTVKESTKHSIKAMCKVLKVSEAGYYKWLKLQNRPYKYNELLAKIRQIRANNSDYGAYRIYLDLKLFHGYIGSYYVVLKLCQQHHLMLKKRRHPKGLTKADLTAQASENLLQQNFRTSSPNQKWLGDITEIPTAHGKLYVSAILDCFDGAIVGFKMANHMRAELCVEAFTAAAEKYHGYGMLFHSDRGSQYTSKAYRETLARYCAQQSMSNTGKCYDNARMESFFATLKKELLYKVKTETLRMETVKSMVFRYIETYYSSLTVTP
ncbi:Transposase InsF for insertion sequence IS3 [Desulfitobacterium hafniense]|uniref:Transposase InsF for insertion sequence IS3 n=1 Tax=Desulfitobacterium hafniense TaxID=49338 RepID=A0A098B2M0_DESHA|nr:IS3 family transposase [Desulfitobacterium hafniense]CDX03129.1 Transposase InsF for insertion sequence IS3 [Desulfitobacterium hafniense]